MDSCENSECKNVEISPLCCNADSDCDDGDACTIGFCDEFECKFVADLDCCQKHSDCDNGIFCDGMELCLNNTCISSSPTCDDNNACTEDSWVCSGLSSGCVFSPIQNCCEKDFDCDDGIFCNGEELCVDNKCIPGSPPDCFGDACSIGQCSLLTDQCIFSLIDNCCKADSDCNDDGSFCNGEEICIDNRCGQGPQPSCDDGNFCTEGFCSKSNDRCEYLQIPECCMKDSDCDNGNWCDGIEICERNQCQSGIVPTCEDSDPCTINSWVCTNDEIRCEVVEIESCCRNDQECQDGIFCNGIEVCFKNKCRVGSVPECFGGDGFCDKNIDQCALPADNEDDFNGDTDRPDSVIALMIEYAQLSSEILRLLADTLIFLIGLADRVRNL